MKIYSTNLANIPWQEKNSKSESPIWRYNENPIVNRNPLPNVPRIFNSAVIAYEDAFIGVFRGETVNGMPYLFLGNSEDAINWNFDKEPIKFINESGEDYNPKYSYDPRLLKIEDTYYIIWCTDANGAALAIAKTTDFKLFTRLSNPFLPFNRNGVLFPRKINGKYEILSRPSDSGHTPFGDIYVSDSPDMKYWGNHRHVMGKSSAQWWQELKIGAGCVPIETDEGWLMIYHGVVRTCNGYVYSMGGAILDIDEPSIVKYRCEKFLLTPEKWYEERGFVPNVIFPCASLCDAKTGKLAIYYGAADTYVCLAFGYVQEIIKYIKDNNYLAPNDNEVER